MKRTKRLIACFLTAFMLLGSQAVWAEEASSYEAFYYETVFRNLMMHYKFEADTETMALEIAKAALNKNPDLLEELINITADSFDKYTDYMTNEELTSFTNSLNGSYVGIGVSITRISGGIEIESVFTGSPAEKAGLKAGDRFLNVNGQDVQGFFVAELQELILGKEGTAVELTMERNGKAMNFTVIRGAVQQSSISYAELENGLGYLKISVFNGNTASEIKQADEFFRGKRIRKLIIDLRDNPGGDLISVVSCLGFFVPQGKTVVKLEYNIPTRNVSYRSVGDIKKNSGYKLAVLINENSASGAELFAGNIRDYKLGKLIGERTFGKGTMQEMVGLGDTDKVKMGKIKLTTAEFLLPSGEKINKVGVLPDIAVSNRIVPLNTEEMEPMEFGYNFKQGDSGKGILALKQRLSALQMFSGELNETFDSDLTVAVREFQKSGGLPVNGMLDMDTETLLANVISQAEVLMDDQFDRAVEYLTIGK